ncbi:ABC transporter substrate-binding protein [Anaerotignum faecicola]|nr:ABC transporter substrate-binding protein [Anaerotignum faecicola]
MKKRIITGLISAVLALSLAACGGNDSGDSQQTAPAEGQGQQTEAETSEPHVGGTLTVGISGEPYNIATWLSNDMNSHLLMNLVLPSMMVVNEKGEKEPYIIESYEASEDLKTYTIKLHDGLTWHDGEPLTAEDLAFTADYCVKHSLSFGADMFKSVESSEVVDDTTVIFHLSIPSVSFVSQMGYWVDIMPKHIYENVDDPMNFEFNGVGYGPYKLTDYAKGEYYTLERVENWPLANDGQGAYLDKIIFRVYADPNALVLAMKNGEVDVSGTELPVSAQNQLADSDGQFTIESVESLGYGYLAFNCSNEFLSDKTVRQALAMTIDRDGIVTAALQGGARKMETPVSPVYTDLVQSNITYPAFDIEGANKLLDDAGYTDTDNDGVREMNGKPMEFEVVYKNSSNNIDAVANIFKSNAEQAGFKINIKSLDIAAFTSNVVQGHDYDINIQEWGVIDDVDSKGLSNIYLSDCSMNFMEYYNENVDSILAQLETEPDKAKRLELLDEFQKIYVDELPVVNCWVRTKAYGCSNKFAGWSLTPGLYGVMDVKDLTHVYEK